MSKEVGAGGRFDNFLDSELGELLIPREALLITRETLFFYVSL